jgi:hypothetical protein
MSTGNVAGSVLATPLSSLTSAIMPNPPWVPASLYTPTYYVGGRSYRSQTEVTRSASGNVAGAYFYDYYFHIHVTPQILALGAILNQLTRTIEVWNAFFVSNTLNSIVSSGNTAGINLTGPAAPQVVGPLGTLVYSVGVQPVGPVSVNATYTFSFSNLAVGSALITGTRSVLFGLRPNWDQGFKERLEWKTDVLFSRAGVEQRMALRQIPRRWFEFTINAYENEYGIFDSLVAGWQSRIYSVPVWSDRQFLTAVLAAGSTVVPCKTQYYDFIVGNTVIIGTDARHLEAAQVQSIASDGVTLTQGTQNTWSPGAFVVPAHQARLQLSTQGTKPTAQLAMYPLQFQLQDQSNVVAVDDSTMFQGIPVCLFVPDRSPDLPVTYERKAVMLDYDIGIQEVDDAPARPFITRTHEFLWGSRAEIWAFRAWLHAKQGQLNSFWMPVYERSFEVQQDITSASANISVLSQEFSVLESGLAGRGAIAILTVDGVWHFQTVTSIQATTNPEVEAMNLGGSFGTLISVASIRIACWLEKLRLGADSAELYWETDNIVRSSLPFTGTNG